MCTLFWGAFFSFKSDRKILNDGHFKIFAAAYTEQGGHAGNNPEPLGVAFHHIVPTFITHILFQGIPANLGPTFINAYIVNMLTNLVD